MSEKERVNEKERVSEKERERERENERERWKERERRGGGLGGRQKVIQVDVCIHHATHCNTLQHTATHGAYTCVDQVMKHLIVILQGQFDNEMTFENFYNCGGRHLCQQHRRKRARS